MKAAVATFVALSGENLNTRLKFDIARNIQILMPTKDALDAARDFSTIPGYKAYASELRGRFIELSENGVVKPGNESAMRAAEMEVEGHHPEAVELALKAKGEFEGLMDQSTGLTIHELNLELFPKELAADISPIVDFIYEDPSEPTGG